MRIFKLLTQTERYQIYALRKANKNPTEINRVLRLHKCTLLTGISIILGNEAIALSKHINLLLDEKRVAIIDEFLWRIGS